MLSRALSFLLLLLLVSPLLQTPSARRVGQAKPNPTASTPEKTVRSFVRFAQAEDFQTLLHYIDDPRPGPELQKVLTTKPTLTYEMPSCYILSVKAVINGETATVFFTHTTDAKNTWWKATEKCKLRRVGGVWKIVLPTLEETRLDSGPPPPDFGLFQSLAHIAQILRNSRGEGVKYSEDERVCRDHLQRIGLATLQFVFDHNERFQFERGQVVQTLIKNGLSEEYLHCPQKKPENSDSKVLDDSYSFNNKLRTWKVASIEFPSRTVMFYEGRNEKLDFRHNGKAFVVFCDGNAYLLDAKEARGLLWKAYKDAVVESL